MNKHEDRQTERQIDGYTERQTDRPANRASILEHTCSPFLYESNSYVFYIAYLFKGILMLICSLSANFHILRNIIILKRLGEGGGGELIRARHYLYPILKTPKETPGVTAH